MVRLTFPQPLSSVTSMESLHAPWRIDYILSPKPPRTGESVFSRIARESQDAENLVLYRGKACFALLNAYPYNGGHLMVVPYRQVASLADLTEAEHLELMQMTVLAQKALREIMNPDGFNMGINEGRVAGAGIEEHLHLHVVPRWNGDTNFMPVLAQTSVLPQALRELASRLGEAMNQISGRQP